MQPVPDHTRNRTRNRSLRFCFRFRFRIWLAVYQFNAHFGARLGFVLCFVFNFFVALRTWRVEFEPKTEDWAPAENLAQLQSRTTTTTTSHLLLVRLVCASCAVPKAARCADRVHSAKGVKMSSRRHRQPREILQLWLRAASRCVLLFLFRIRIPQFAFCILFFVFRIFVGFFFFADWFYSWLCLFFRSSCQRSSFDSIGQFTTPHTLLFYFVLFGQWKYLVKRRYTYFVEGILTLTGRRRRGRLYKV